MDDVLPETLLAGAMKADYGRLPEESRRGVRLQALKHIAVDGERQIANGVVKAHRVWWSSEW